MNFLFAFYWLIYPPTIIDVQPFSDMSPQEVSYIYKELKKVYPFVVLKPTMDISASTYYKPRNRYRADKLIQFLSTQNTTNHVTIGLTTKDISTTNGKIYDWGVMGLGYCPGPSCMVSDFRLSKTDRYNQFFKVAIHELGHTQGLPHCPVKTCFMQDAKGKNSTAQEKEFCSKCKSFLISKGWKFN